jgi:hypothetical protein
MPRRLPGAAEPRECQPAGEGSLGLPGNQGFLGGFDQVGSGPNLQPIARRGDAGAKSHPTLAAQENLWETILCSQKSWFH